MLIPGSSEIKRADPGLTGNVATNGSAARNPWPLDEAMDSGLAT
jgi:hypothetical protein